MVAGWVLLGVSLGYVALLFAVAYFGDRRPLYPERTPLRPIIYSLALAVYCSSWTFYGAVGTAVSSGWGFLPIYLGPILLFVFGIGLLQRLVQVTHEQNITSIAPIRRVPLPGQGPAAALLFGIAWRMVGTAV